MWQVRRAYRKWMQRRPPPPAAPRAPNALFDRLRKPQYLIPIAVVGGMIAIAFGIQPGGQATPARGANAPVVATRTPIASSPTAVIASPTAKPSVAPGTPSAQPTNARGTPTVPNLTGQNPVSIAAGGESDVAGARGTPEASVTVAADLSRQSTQCGAIQETAMALSVEQGTSGTSVKASRVAVYPIEYFRCILMATGGVEAINLAQSVSKAANGGMTHAVLVDLWMTNAGKEFGQLNLKTATLAVAGQSFGPLATLGGRSEVVVSSGQGRNVTLVVAVKSTIGPTTGPMTLILEAPLIAGKQTLGKYQLFLPTP